MNGLDRSARGYNRLARWYQWLERLAFRNQLQVARTAMLDHLPMVDQALVLGDGNGRLLEQLCLAQPQCEVLSVDQSEMMLKLQRQRLDHAGFRHNVQLVQRDARDYQPAKGQFDLLVTAFLLDCFTESELVELLPGWLSAVKPGGSFYFVDFCRPPAGWRRLRADFYLSLMHRFFGWTTGLPNRQLLDLDAILETQPISCIASQTTSHGLITSRLYRVEALPMSSAVNQSATCVSTNDQPPTPSIATGKLEE